MGQTKTVEIVDSDASTIQALLNYLYTRELGDEKHDSSVCARLLQVAVKYDITNCSVTSPVSWHAQELK